MRQPRRPTLSRAARWSKRTDDLVRYVALTCGPSFRSELGHWIEDSPRFGAFVDVNRDKIRKKFRNADGAEGRLDVRSELRVARLLLSDRRFEVAFEGFGARRPGPDLTVTYRVNQRFNLEVTRVRVAADAGRLGNLVTAKLRQLPPELPNALVIAGRELAITETEVAQAARLLKTHNDSSDDAFFERRGLGGARDFYAHFLRLSGVLVLDEARAPLFWANPEARRPLPAEVVARLVA
ncbi:MAG TPA: hypothetical protein VGK33_18860 [Chloroflexota bacterium]